MTLLVSGDDGGVERCVRCGAVAAGPCARCTLPVCGDCVELTRGGANVWAVCDACVRTGGRSLRRGWVAVLSWILLPIAALWALVEILEHVAR